MAEVDVLQAAASFVARDIEVAGPIGMKPGRRQALEVVSREAPMMMRRIQKQQMPPTSARPTSAAA